MKKFKPYFQISTLVAGNRKKVNLLMFMQADTAS